MKNIVLRFDLPTLIPAFCATLLLTSMAVAADEASPEPAVPEKNDAADLEDRFPVPDGTIKELFTFIESVQKAVLPEKLRTKEKSVGFFREQIAAILGSCDKIEALKPEGKDQVRLIEERFGAYQNLSRVDPEAKAEIQKLVAQFETDERPEIIRLMTGYTLETRTPGFFQLSPQQQGRLIQDLLTYMDRFDLDSISYGVSKALVDALETSNAPEMAVPILEQLVKSLRQTGDPRAAQEIARYEGTARRLNLPGSFMEISGTTVEGDEFDWESYRGKVVLVDFWASWCGPCRAEIPNMKAQLEKYADKGFAIVGISLDSSKEEYQACIDREEIPWISLMNPDESKRGWDEPLALKYGVSGIPMAILVDKDGKVVSLNAIGAELNELLAQMLGDAPPAE